MPKRPDAPDAFRPEESPIFWFRELIADDDAEDYPRMSACRGELDRLGWRVTRRKPRLAPAGEGDGRDA